MSKEEDLVQSPRSLGKDPDLENVKDPDPGKSSEGRGQDQENQENGINVQDPRSEFQVVAKGLEIIIERSAPDPDLDRVQENEEAIQRGLIDRGHVIIAAAKNLQDEDTLRHHLPLHLHHHEHLVLINNKSQRVFLSHYH